MGGGEDGEWELLNLSQFLPIQIIQTDMADPISFNDTAWSIILDPLSFYFSIQLLYQSLQWNMWRELPKFHNLGYCPYFSLSHPAKYPTHIFILHPTTFEATNYKRFSTNVKIKCMKFARKVGGFKIWVVGFEWRLHLHLLRRTDLVTVASYDVRGRLLTSSDTSTEYLSFKPGAESGLKPWKFVPLVGLM